MSYEYHPSTALHIRFKQMASIHYMPSRPPEIIGTDSEGRWRELEDRWTQMVMDDRELMRQWHDIPGERSKAEERIRSCSKALRHCQIKSMCAVTRGKRQEIEEEMEKIRKSEREIRSEIDSREKDVNSRFDKKTREGHGPREQMEAERLHMLMKEEEKRAEQKRLKKEKRAMEERERQAEIDRSLKRSEHERFVQLKKKMETDIRAETHGQEELALPYAYNDLSLSPSRFRLLRLHSARESLPLGQAPDAVAAPRPKATESVRRQYDLQLFDMRESHRHHQIEWHRRYEGALQCSMQTFDLEDPDCPLFEALSYEWKANSHKGNKRLIFSDGSRVLGSMEIGYNLWSFLKHVQQPDDAFWVWADAVCINQTSLQERGHQVKLMGRIYSRAFKVLAWLPLKNPEPCAAKWKQLMAGETLSRNETGEAMDLFDSNYWTRKWIIQEILLARTVVLVLGAYELPMQDLENLFGQQELTKASQPSPLNLVSGSLPFAKLASYRRSRREGRTYPQELHELLPMYQTNMCSDPFDHVYALYNLIGEHRRHLDVKYGEPPRLWISKVLEFLDRCEQSSHDTIVNLAATLSRQNQVHDLHTGALSHQESTIHLTATGYDQGTLVPREECSTSIRLREQVSSLHPGAKLTLKMSSKCWQVQHRVPTSAMAEINRRVLYYFDIPEHSLTGLAAARIEDGDHVLTFNNTNFGFVVRFEKSSTEDAEQHLRILGRCYLFEKSSAGSSTDSDENWKLVETFGSDRSPSNGQKAQPNLNKLHSNGKKLEKKLSSHDFKLSISDLFTLAYAATDVDFPRKAS